MNWDTSSELWFAQEALSDFPRLPSNGFPLRLSILSYFPYLKEIIPSLSVVTKISNVCSCSLLKNWLSLKKIRRNKSKGKRNHLSRKKKRETNREKPKTSERSSAKKETKKEKQTLCQNKKMFWLNHRIFEVNFFYFWFYFLWSNPLSQSHFHEILFLNYDLKIKVFLFQLTKERCGRQHVKLKGFYLRKINKIRRRRRKTGKEIFWSKKFYHQGSKPQKGYHLQLFVWNKVFAMKIELLRVVVS